MDREERMGREHEMGRNAEKLDAFWAAYRNAFPEGDSGADFMPGLWRKIESRRSDSIRVFRRLAQVCVMATVALTLLIGAVLIPRIQTDAFFVGTYADELAAQNVNVDYTDFLNAGDLR